MYSWIHRRSTRARQAPSRLSLAAALAFALTPLTPSASDAQAPSGADARRIHELAAYATVRIDTGTGSFGSGWLLEQSGRPLIITNAHVVRRVGRSARAFFYRGASAADVPVPVERFYISGDIDLGILRLTEDPPATARPVPLHTDTDVYRGERVVLGGNPSSGQTILPFQTTEGVVTGHVSGRAYAQCGLNRNCVVVDATSFRGSSGGPAFDGSGRLVGMLWGGPTQTVSVGHTAVGSVQNVAFSYLIHTRTIAAELRALEAP
ncbi:MAG: serine protease [Sandaracinaceae bacterium]